MNENNNNDLLHRDIPPISNRRFRVENSPVSHLKELNDSASHLVVLMDEFTIFRGNEQNVDVIETIGAGPCQLLCLRDPESQKTLLAHIDSNQNKSPYIIFMLRVILSQFSNEELSRAKAIISGEQDYGSEYALDVVTRVLGFSGIKPQLVQSSSLAVNVHSGELFKVTNYNQILHPDIKKEPDRWLNGKFLFPSQDSRIIVSPLEIIMSNIEKNSDTPTDVRLDYRSLLEYANQMKIFRGIDPDLTPFNQRKESMVAKLSK